MSRPQEFKGISHIKHKNIVMLSMKFNGGKAVYIKHYPVKGSLNATIAEALSEKLLIESKGCANREEARRLLNLPPLRSDSADDGIWHETEISHACSIKREKPEKIKLDYSDQSIVNPWLKRIEDQEVIVTNAKKVLLQAEQRLETLKTNAKAFDEEFNKDTGMK
jgi:hypothetical protein